MLLHTWVPHCDHGNRTMGSSMSPSCSARVDAAYRNSDWGHLQAQQQAGPGAHCDQMTLDILLLPFGCPLEDPEHQSTWESECRYPAPN